MLDMYMLRFVAIEAVEEKAIRTGNILDCWHCVVRLLYL